MMKLFKNELNFKAGLADMPCVFGRTKQTPSITKKLILKKITTNLHISFKLILMLIYPSITSSLSPNLNYSSIKLIKSKQYLSICLCNNLENSSTKLSSKDTFSTTISFDLIMSLISLNTC